MGYRSPRGPGLARQDTENAVGVIGTSVATVSAWGGTGRVSAGKNLARRHAVNLHTWRIVLGRRVG